MLHIKNLPVLAATLCITLLLCTHFAERAQAGFTCGLEILKQATPSDGTVFDFTCSSPVNCSGQPNPMLRNGDSINFAVNPNDTATVVEFPPQDWKLDEIICTVDEGDPNLITFDLDSVENGVFITCLAPSFDDPVFSTCTFSNIKTCNVTIAKTTAFDNDETLFDFTAPGSSNPDFTLSKGEEIELEIKGGENVDVTELVPSGWELEQVDCSEPDGVVITEIPNGKNFACSINGGSADCAYMNVAVRNVPTLSEWGLIALAGVLGLIALLAIRRKKATA